MKLLSITVYLLPLIIRVFLIILRSRRLDVALVDGASLLRKLGLEMARDWEASPSKIEIAWANFICGLDDVFTSVALQYLWRR